MYSRALHVAEWTQKVQVYRTSPFLFHPLSVMSLPSTALIRAGQFGFVSLLDSQRLAIEFECIVLEVSVGLNVYLYCAAFNVQ